MRRERFFSFVPIIPPLLSHKTDFGGGFQLFFGVFKENNRKSWVAKLRESFFAEQKCPPHTAGRVLHAGGAGHGWACGPLLPHRLSLVFLQYLLPIF
jgi:hypothetical protein